MKKLSLFCGAALLVLTASSTFAASSICPVVTGTPNGSTIGGGVSTTYVADSGVTNGGCNVLITYGPSGPTTSQPNLAVSYDAGDDDVLVGIINNTGHTLNSITLTGSNGNDIFGFEGDGACDGWVFAGGNPCGTATSGYLPQGITASNVSTDNTSGTINFAGGLANGATAWFSLEGPVDLTIAGNTTPEPTTLALAGIGGLLAVFGARRRRSL